MLESSEKRSSSRESESPSSRDERHEKNYYKSSRQRSSSPPTDYVSSTTFRGIEASGYTGGSDAASSNDKSDSYGRSSTHSYSYRDSESRSTPTIVKQTKSAESKCFIYFS